METPPSPHKDDESEIKMNIKQFIEATRQYLFNLAQPPARPLLATIPIRPER